MTAKNKLQEQIQALVIIDHSEWFFWHMHEHANEEQWKQNQEDKEGAIKLLKTKFCYSDDDIKKGIEFLNKLAKKVKE